MRKLELSRLAAAQAMEIFCPTVRMFSSSNTHCASALTSASRSKNGGLVQADVHSARNPCLVRRYSGIIDFPPSSSPRTSSTANNPHFSVITPGTLQISSRPSIFTRLSSHHATPRTDRQRHTVDEPRRPIHPAPAPLAFPGPGPSMTLCNPTCLAKISSPRRGAGWRRPAGARGTTRRSDVHGTYFLHMRPRRRRSPDASLALGSGRLTWGSAWRPFRMSRYLSVRCRSVGDHG